MAASLISCATSYQSGGFTGGYTEKKISESAYVVTFGGNGFASKDRIYNFWMYRCAELTLEKGYSLFSIHSNQSASLDRPPESIRPAVYDPRDGGSLVKTGGGGGVVVVPVPGGGGPAKWTYSGTVLMYKKPLPEELLGAADAAAIVATLKPYVDSNGAVAAPTRNELFKRGYIAHARIAVEPSILATASEPNDDLSKPPRSAEQLTEVIESQRMVTFQAAYRDYVTHPESGASQRDTSGHVVLAFSVSSNGQVTRSQITSSTFLDAQFNSAIEKLLKQTEFGPKDVAATDVTNFDVSFGPW